MLHELGMTTSTHQAPARHKCHNRKPLQRVMYGVSSSNHEPYTQECQQIGNESDVKCDGCAWRSGAGNLPAML